MRHLWAAQRTTGPGTWFQKAAHLPPRRIEELPRRRAHAPQKGRRTQGCTRRTTCATGSRTCCGRPSTTTRPSRSSRRSRNRHASITPSAFRLPKSSSASKSIEVQRVSLPFSLSLPLPLPLSLPPSRSLVRARVLSPLPLHTRVCRQSSEGHERWQGRKERPNQLLRAKAKVSQTRRAAYKWRNRRPCLWY